MADRRGSFLRRDFFALLVGVFLASPALSQTLRDAEYKAATTQGLTYLYQLEHDRAIDFFHELGERYPDHPGPPLARSVAIWIRELFAREDLDIERFISPGYFTRPAPQKMREEDRKAFFEGIERSQDNAQRYLDAHPGDIDARYYLGACQGALSVFAFTIDRSFRRALKHGKESHRIQSSVIEDDPDFDDSYMTVGTYEYVVANLPWYVKWLAILAGYRGSEAQGFEYVARAAEQGYIVKDDARVLLMVMYVREQQYEYALEMARQLHRRYPQNFLFHLNQAQILERMGEKRLAAGAYATVARKAAAGVPNYQKLPLDKIRYSIGQRLLALGSQEEALEQFQDAARDTETPERERVLSHLRAGEILDTMGRRDEAVNHYQLVQQLPEFEGSHVTAEEYLRQPYQPE